MARGIKCIAYAPLGLGCTIDFYTKRIATFLFIGFYLLFSELVGPMQEMPKIYYIR